MKTAETLFTEYWQLVGVGTYRYITFLLLYIAIAHLCGCAWFAIGFYYDGPINWRMVDEIRYGPQVETHEK